MAADFDLKIGGPAQPNLGGTAIGHTSGGITHSITQQNREVTVDQFGVSACNIRHTGDNVRWTIPFSENVAAQIQEIYVAGIDDLAGTPKTLGIGRQAGFIYTTKTFKAVPYLTADANVFLDVFRACPIGSFTLTFSVEADVVQEVEFIGLVDESKTDGALIAKYQIGA